MQQQLAIARREFAVAEEEAHWWKGEAARRGAMKRWAYLAAALVRRRDRALLQDADDTAFELMQRSLQLEHAQLSNLLYISRHKVVQRMGTCCNSPSRGDLSAALPFGVC